MLVCAGKLTYPIKYNSDKLGITGVSYVERLTDYLIYNRHIEKIIFVETVDNTFNQSDLHGFTGDITIITKQKDKYEQEELEESYSDVQESNLGSDEPEDLDEQESDEQVTEQLSTLVREQIKCIKELEGLRVSDIQWEIMNS